MCLPRLYTVPFCLETWVLQTSCHLQCLKKGCMPSYKTKLYPEDNQARSGSLEEVPTSAIILSYQAAICDLCMRSWKVSVPVTLLITPNSERSLKSGFSPPRNGLLPIQYTSNAQCTTSGSGGQDMFLKIGVLTLLELLPLQSLSSLYNQLNVREIAALQLCSKLLPLQGMTLHKELVRFSSEFQVEPRACESHPGCRPIRLQRCTKPL